MRVDSEILSGRIHFALSRLAESMGQDAPSYFFAAQLMALGRLLFEPPLDSFTSEARANLHSAAGDQGLPMATALRREWTSKLISCAENLAVVDASRVSNVRATLGDLLRKLERFDAVSDLTVLQNRLKKQLDLHLESDLNTDIASGSLGEVASMVDQLGSALDVYEGFESLFIEMNTEQGISEFERYYHAMKAASVGTLPQERPAKQIEWLFPAVRVLVEEVQRILAQQPLVHHVVKRLRVFMETFARDEILAAMQSLAARGTNNQNERVLQQFVDRFLFSEGLFPLTHVRASGGSIDTFWEDVLPTKLQEAGVLGSPPALIELKQVVCRKDGEPNASGVSKAVSDALAQAAVYRQHLSSNQKWSTSTVYALVAYDGATRFFLRTPVPSVALVYLGTEPPHGKKAGIDIG